MLVSFQQDPRLHGFRDALWWAFRVGIFVPSRWSAGAVVWLDITDLGRKVIAEDEHPLAPHFVLRLLQRCPGLPDEVIVHFEDAHACRERRLLRASVILVGLAYETLIEAILEALNTKAVVLKIPDKPAGRIDALRKAVVTIGQRSKDTERDRAFSAAIDFADELRRRRNDGSHTQPQFPFDDESEVDDLLLSAARHAIRLWPLASVS